MISKTPIGGETHRAKLIDTAGPWPFVSRRVYLHEGQQLVWRSRDHRRGLRRGHRVRQALRQGRAEAWNPECMNPWIGSGFTTGSFLFVAGAVLALWPDLAHRLSLSETQVNAVFFIGSIFFTLAAYLQLYQAANPGALPDGPHAPSHRVLVGWQPLQIGWLSSFLQFLGTLLFNVSTFMAVGSLGTWLRQDLTIWGPDFFGSVLFLASGYLAFIETCHHYWAWRPWDISWWIVLLNLIGCVAFMVSAFYAFVPAGGPDPALVAVSVAATLAGALGFLSGSVLMLDENHLVSD